jgi:uncharacterized membrane protein
MTGSLAALALATAVFVASHVVLSTLPIRSRLVAALGETGFRLGYSLLALALLAWLVAAYRAAPFVELWWPPPGLRHLSLLLVAVASVLLVAGLTTAGPAPIQPGRGNGAGVAAASPVGIYRITRHPAMWALGLWAVAHLLANGDRAAVILFAGMAGLALAGAINSDHRRRAVLGDGWAGYRAQTSFLPFQAILAGRTRLRLGEIGLARLAGGLALFAALLFAHPWLFGVSPLPG